MLTGDMLRRSAKRFPSKPAIICGSQVMTYTALDSQANQLANALLTLGLEKGAKVGILCRNIIEYGVAFFGVARSGYVLTNVSVLYAPDELVYVLEQADVEVLIYDKVFAGKIREVRPNLAAIKTYLEIGASDLPRPEPPDELHESKPTLNFNEFLATAPTNEPDVDLDEDDPFCMTYTGGTTGRPKGVLFSHRGRSVTAHTVMVEEAIDERDVVGIVTPMFHVAALNIMFQPAILAGATVALLTKWSPEAFQNMVADTSMTANFMVPTQAAMLLQFGASATATASPASSPTGEEDSGLNLDKLKTWRKVSFAGAPLPDWVQRELRAVKPDLDITQIYGQSEMGVIAVLRDWYLPQKLGSVGRQPYNVDVRVVDAEGFDVAPGEIGEVVSRGDNLMLEYYNDPEQTAQFDKLGDGWGWSGDVATIDDEGFITLVDRSKDMIISGGENIYPKEVENVIYELDAVFECAVFGAPHDKWGEVPVAYVSLKPATTLSEIEVVEHCERKLATFKRPSLVKFVDDFPKTAIGKIQKTVLKEALWEHREKKI